jgi:hypothetical protein
MWLTAAGSTFVQADIDRAFVFAGGLAVIWFAAEMMIDVIRK